MMEKLEQTTLRKKLLDMSKAMLEAALNDYKDLVDFLERISVRELTYESVLKEDNERLKVIGGEMENIFLALYIPPQDDGEFSISPSERDMLNVADIQRIGRNSVNIPEWHYLEVGSGNFFTINVIYRIKGRYHFGCGSVMNYYEFLSDKVITDDDFRKKVGTPYVTPENPLMPYFIDSLYLEPYFC